MGSPLTRIEALKAVRSGKGMRDRTGGTSRATAFPRRDVDGVLAAALAHGQRLPAGGIDGTYGVFDQDGHVIALAVDDGPTARPLVVLAPA